MPRESEASKVAKERRERMGSPASKVTWVLRVTRARVVFKDPEVRTDLRAPRASQDLVERPALSDWLERRGSSESQDCPGTLANKAPRARTDSLDSPGQTERREQGESPAKQALEGNVAQRVHVEAVVREDRQENQAQRAPQAMMDLLALLERGDPKALKDPLVCLDLKDQMALQEKTGCPAILDSEERRASKERPDLLDLEGWLDHRVQLERSAPAESEDIQDPLDHLVSKVYLEPLEKRAEREIQVLRVLAENQDLLV